MRCRRRRRRGRRKRRLRQQTASRRFDRVGGRRNRRQGRRRRWDIKIIISVAASGAGALAGGVARISTAVAEIAASWSR